VTTLQFNAFGDPAEQLTPIQCDAAKNDTLPSSGEVRLRVRFSPVHPSDLNLIQGVYGLRPELPAIPGGEASAIVDAIADDVDVNDLAVGDHVILRTRIGAWRETAFVDAADCYRVSSDIDLAQAAMLAINPTTAWRMLSDFAPLKPGDWVLQNAANSAVGRCVIQLAKALGLRTINLVRRESLVDELTALGADAVIIDDGDKSTGEHVAGLMGESPAQLALNAVGGDSALRLMAWLAPGGIHVTYGAMGRRPLKVPNSFLIFKNIQLRGFWLTEWQRHASRESIDKMLGEVASHMAAGRLTMPIAEIYRPDQCSEAMTAAASSSRNGKILFEFNPDTN